MRTLTRLAAFFVLVLAASSARAQEGQFASDLRREGEHVKESCTELKKVGACALTIATDYPFHLALGSLAPQSGVAFGLAFVEHYTPNEQWRLGWNADAVAARSGSWRGGAYMKIIHTDRPGITVVRPGAARPGANQVAIREYPVFNVYAQAISLDRVLFFGPGPSTAVSGKSAFSERQTIVGTNAIVPITKSAAFQPLRASLVGGVNVRSVSVSGLEQPTFTQLEEGVRLKPSLFANGLRLNYLAKFDQFLAGESSRSSFHRWTLDLRHEIPLYRNVASTGPRDTNGPDECFSAVGTNTCPSISYSRNREGTVSVRLLASSSNASSGSSVPFYFQQTLGGSDINGQRMLASFEDYRFRGPHLLLAQEGVEHSIWGPIGAYVLAEHGMVANRRSELGLGDARNSVSVGVTVRAGGFPMINLSYAWGGDNNHFIATMDSSLLGGSGRPSLH